MTIQPIHLFALLGIGFGFSRVVTTGKEGLPLALILPLGLLWLELFP